MYIAFLVCKAEIKVIQKIEKLDVVEVISVSTGIYVGNIHQDLLYSLDIVPLLFSFFFS